MSTTGHPQHRDALRPCCPSCDSLNVKIYKHGTGRCYSCGAAFGRANVRKAMTHRRPAKSVPVQKPKAPVPDGPYKLAEPVRERPFVKITYDMMSHARLCMAARR